MRARQPASLLLAALLLSACSRNTEHAIGVILPLEGRHKQGGHELQAGIDLALAELPAELRPRVLVVDDGGEPRRAAALVDDLVAEGASVILGPLTTDEVVAAALAAGPLGVACVAPAAGGESLLAPGSRCLRFGFGDEEVGAALARHARGTLRLSQVALVVDLGAEDSLGFGRAFGREFQRLGGRIAGRVGFHAGQQDVEGALDAAVALGAEGVLVAACAPDLLRMVNGARDPRLRQQILLGGDGWEGDGVRAALAGRVRGAYRARHFDPESDDPLVRAFVESYRARHLELPSDRAALGYDAARAVLSVFDPELSGAALGVRLRALRDCPGVTGTLTLDAAGAAVDKPILLEQLHDPDRPAGMGRLDG